MDLSKLTTQLVKEAEKSPVKAGALGLLTLVALWFWAPLVWGWFRPGDSPAGSAPAETAPVATATNSSPAPAIAAIANPAQLDWQGLIRARRLDPKMAIATWNHSLRDPFCEVAPPQPAIEQPTAAIAATPQATTKSLSELGLVLQGVMLGSKAKSATINGQTLLEGAKFAVDQDGRISKKPAGERGIEFELHQVLAAEVLLVSGGVELKLPLKKRGASSGTIEITRTP